MSLAVDEFTRSSSPNSLMRLSRWFNHKLKMLDVPYFSCTKTDNTRNKNDQTHQSFIWPDGLTCFGHMFIYIIKSGKNSILLMLLLGWVVFYFMSRSRSETENTSNVWLLSDMVCHISPYSSASVKSSRNSPSSFRPKMPQKVWLKKWEPLLLGNTVEHPTT